MRGDGVKSYNHQLCLILFSFFCTELITPRIFSNVPTASGKFSNGKCSVIPWANLSASGSFWNGLPCSKTGVPGDMDIDILCLLLFCLESGVLNSSVSPERPGLVLPILETFTFEMGLHGCSATDRKKYIK